MTARIIPFPPVGEDHPILRVVDDLLSRKSENVAWLERAGPIAARLNEESRHDLGSDAVMQFTITEGAA